MRIANLILAFSMLIILLANFASALPVLIDSVEINDVILSPNATNRIDVERGQDLGVTVKLTGVDSLSNVEVEAFISGFEFNDVERVSDTTGLFDVLANVTYVKRLLVPLPDSLEKDDYKLRIIVSDRNNQEILQNYNLKIDVPRHLVSVKDVLLTPENEITAGGALLASVRVENLGAKPEEDIKVKVAVPELGISATKYISKVSSDGETESEEVFLRLPECIKPGRYDVTATVYYADSHRTSVGKSSINILNNEFCDADGNTVSNNQAPSKVVISLGATLESVEIGGNAVFPITLSNNGRTSKSFTVLPSAGDWAALKLSPTATAVLDAGKSQTFYIFVAPKEDAGFGARTVTASILSSGEVVQQVEFTANVIKTPGQDTGLSLKRMLEIGLIVLLALLIIVALIVGFVLLREDDFEPPQKTEPYY